MRRKLLPVNLESYRPLGDIVFETIREAIISGYLRPGERLMEVQLAEEMGVSRTPVREAIRKLEQEGFLVIVPRKGAYVAGISLKDIADVFEIRASMESLAAGLAAQRITEEELNTLKDMVVSFAESADHHDLKDIVHTDTDFHDIIYKASRNERLIPIINNLREQIQRYRATSLAFPGRIKITVEEHRKMVEAISNKNVVLAQNLARAHVENAMDSMLVALKSSNQLSGQKNEE
ncbi:GntR family transcriptional regulator [Dehalobacterium formicoaceticum]|uniref:GntR family transcriptional regulator n=1 Tax=Dehalobacterium formicoaceticum TaxID=51515 RepID=A0ABT1Y5F0_9FIRM|nr:GntR family transcriptional regulator [Dehalobacterium formicoaceticum]MCR6545350.1 GntR family transcriptional regulator [Dehalobacterium formicoaceticum]